MRCTNCSSHVRPIAVFDIDGTLARYHQAVADFSSRYFDTLPIPYEYDGSVPFRDYLELTQAQHREMKLAYRQGGNKRFVPIYAGALEAVESFRKVDAEIWMATTRPFNRLDNIDPDTREWLRRNHIEIDGLLFGEDKYQQLVDTVDQERIVICFEDLAEMMFAGRALGLPMWHVYRAHNKALRYPGGDLAEGVAYGLTQIERWREQNGH